MRGLIREPTSQMNLTIYSSINLSISIPLTFNLENIKKIFKYSGSSFISLLMLRPDLYLLYDSFIRYS